MSTRHASQYFHHPEPEVHQGREFPKESHYVFTNAGGQTREAKGDMIYEYAYMGMPDPAAHV